MIANEGETTHCLFSRQAVIVAGVFFLTCQNSSFEMKGARPFVRPCFRFECPFRPCLRFGMYCPFIAFCSIDSATFLVRQQLLENRPQGHGISVVKLHNKISANFLPVCSLVGVSNHARVILPNVPISNSVGRALFTSKHPLLINAANPIWWT